jgi:hypothetical protein
MDYRKEITQLTSDGRNFVTWREDVIQRLESINKYGYRLNKFIVEPVPEAPVLAEGASPASTHQLRSRQGNASGSNTLDLSESLLSDVDRYDSAEAYVRDFVISSVAEQLRGGLRGMKPIAIMKQLQDRFIPLNTSSIAMCEGNLQSLQVEIKGNTYDTVLAYVERVDELQKERVLIDGNTFANNFILHTVLSTLGEIEDQRVDTYTMVWKGTNVRGADFTYEDYRAYLLAVLMTDKNEQETRQRRVASATANVSVKQSSKRQRSKTNEGKLEEGKLTVPEGSQQPARKKSRGNLKEGVKGDLGRPKCNYCKKMGHLEEHCFQKYPELRTTTTAKDSIKKEVNLCLTEDLHREQSHVYEASVSPSENRRARKGGWYVDSGASDWICNDRATFCSYQAFRVPRSIILGDNSSVQAEGYGSILLSTPEALIRVDNVLLGTKMGINLISVKRLTQKGSRVTFYGEGGTITLNDTVIATIVPDDKLGLYRLDGIAQDIDFAPGDVTSYFITVNLASVAAIQSEASSRSADLSLPPSNLIKWHRRLGHLHLDGVRKLLRSLDIPAGLSTSDQKKIVCEPCIYGKQTSQPNRASATNRATEPLELIHIDTNGPWSTPSLNKRHTEISNATPHMAKHVLELICDATGYTWTFFYSCKATFRMRFIQFVTMTRDTVKEGRRVRRVRIDNAREFNSGDIQDFCDQEGIEIEPSAPYAHEQNGKAERGNRTLRDMASSILIESGLLEGFWAEAFRAATYTRNRCPSNRSPAPGSDDSQTSRTSYELFYNRAPEYEHLRPFGCAVYVTTPREKRVKTLSQHRAWKGIFIGYTKTTKQYRVWDVSRKVISIARDVKVVEEVMPARDSYDKYFPGWKRSYNEKVILNEIPGHVEGRARAQQLEESIASSAKQQHGPRQFLDSVVITTKRPSSIQPETQLENQPESQPENEPENGPESQPESEPEHVTSSEHQPGGKRGLRRSRRQAHYANAARIYDASTDEPAGIPIVPLTLDEAMSLPDSDRWKEAVGKELASLMANNTFKELDSIPKGKKVMGARWVFKHKTDPDDDTLAYKARLVIKGYEQRFGIHYTETYAPVVNLRTVRVFLALVAFLDLELHQMDINTAFLNATLPEHERILMQLPQGYTPTSNTARALLLMKSLYGLKQAPLLWNKDMHDFLTSDEFPFKLTRSYADECLYIGKDLMLLVYVDDFLIATRGLDVMVRAKAAIMTKYKSKDLGEPRKFLGLRITRDRTRRTLRIDQEEYSKSIIKRFGFENTKPRDTPMMPGIQLTTEPQEESLSAEDGLLYRSMLGSLSYATQGTRGDLAHTTMKLGQFASNPSTQHWQAMDWAYRYLLKTSDYGIVYDGSTFDPHGYTDADYAQCLGGEPIRRRSTSGYTWQICNASVSWSSKLQSTIALSSTEAEVIASNHSAKEGVWLRKLLVNLIPFISPSRSPNIPLQLTTLYTDNTAAIQVSSEPGNQQRTKHYDVAYFWIRERLRNGEFKLVYKATADMTADIFTKSLPRPAHIRHVEGLGLRAREALDTDH